MHNLKIRIRNAIVAVTNLVGVGIGTVVVAAPAQAATNGWVTACFKFTPSRGGAVWTGAQTAMTYRGNWPTYSLPQTSRNGCTTWVVAGNLRTAINAAYTPGGGYQKWYGQTPRHYIPAGRHLHLGWHYVYPVF